MNSHQHSILNQYKTLTKDYIIGFDKYIRFNIVHHTCGLLGSNLNCIESYILLDERLTPENKLVDFSFMAVDFHSALDFILELAQQKTTLTVEHILQVLSIMYKTSYNSSENADQEFKSYNQEKLNQVYLEINSIANNQLDFQKVNNHAFSVYFNTLLFKNPRLSQLLMNYIQHLHQQPLTFVLIDDKYEFELTQNSSKIKFINFMYKELFKNLENQINILKDEPKKGKSFNGIRMIF